MRGEHFSSMASAVKMTGSSPHARGAPARGRKEDVREGIIPACAGSTIPGGPRAPCDEDHPRMRGEHSWTAADVICGRGSSPHARGAPPRGALCTALAGIIPACAGSTGRAFSIPSGGRDHPRMRGEHDHTFVISTAVQGSSPHARGAREDGGSYDDGRGIIPACAGSTSASASGRWGCWDHPRMRGEHAGSGCESASRRGSSPHARGARVAKVDVVQVDGIIPACAGSTL